jgi:hypothetical protein
MRSNQIRLYCSSIAYCPMQALRRLGLAGAEMAKAQCQTIRLRLLKIGAQAEAVHNASPTRPTPPENKTPASSASFRSSKRLR